MSYYGGEKSYFGTTPMGMGYAGHEQRVSMAPRAVDVMAARFALEAVAADQNGLEQTIGEQANLATGEQAEA